jgi:hypothetical protein
MNHTDLPWRVATKHPCRILDDTGIGVIAMTCFPVDEGTEYQWQRDNAEYIVQCVNSHDELVANCRNLLQWINTIYEQAGPDVLIDAQPKDYGRGYAMRLLARIDGKS